MLFYHGLRCGATKNPQTDTYGKAFVKIPAQYAEAVLNVVRTLRTVYPFLVKRFI
jgi:hypothetical protein